MTPLTSDKLVKEYATAGTEPTLLSVMRLSNLATAMSETLLP